MPLQAIAGLSAGHSTPGWPNMQLQEPRKQASCGSPLHCTPQRPQLSGSPLMSMHSATPGAVSQHSLFSKPLEVQNGLEPQAQRALTPMPTQVDALPTLTWHCSSALQ